MAGVVYKQITPATPEVAKKAFDFLHRVKNSGGHIRKGIHGTTKAIRSGDAKLVFIRYDLEFPEQVLHLPTLCEEKNVPYVFVPEHSRYGIGDSAAIVDLGGARALYYRLIREIDLSRRLI